MINGTIGLIGNTYTIDCKMFSVATGAAESMKNVSYQGEVDGLITEMEILAWDILEIPIPQKLKKKRQMGMAAFMENQAFVAPKTKIQSLIRSAVCFLVSVSYTMIKRSKDMHLLVLLHYLVP